MAIFNGTLEARDRLSLPDNASMEEVLNAMRRSGDLIEIRLNPAYYLGPVLDQRNQVILSWLRGRFWNLAHHPIPVKTMREVVKKETGWVDQQLIWTLRRAWKAGQVRYLIAGLYQQGMSPQAVEDYREGLFETEEIFLCCRDVMAREGNRGMFHGVHYILIGESESGQRNGE